MYFSRESPNIRLSTFFEEDEQKSFQFYFWLQNIMLFSIVIFCIKKDPKTFV